MLENTKQTKIIKFTNVKQYEQVLDEIRDGLRDGTIIDAMVVAHQRTSDKPAYRVIKYWFGLSHSCVMILGLLQYMIGEVQDFILREDDDE
jgi:hypothetical protein